MTDIEIEALRALCQVRMPVGSPHKRFRNDIDAAYSAHSEFRLTAPQAIYLWGLVNRYRRQVSSRVLREHAAAVVELGSLPAEWNPEGSHREALGPSKRPVRVPPKTKYDDELERGKGRLAL